mmetsp:Transcript_14770/g.20946  ORF Transcript_14770/g.20946 Transcript_14770/m.20946 type:complete len:147 (+) Transcript_14770:1477-1917(+)
MTVQISCTIIAIRLQIFTFVTDDDDDEEDDDNPDNDVDLVFGRITSAKHIGCIIKINTHSNHSIIRYQYMRMVLLYIRTIHDKGAASRIASENSSSDMKRQIWNRWCVALWIGSKCCLSPPTPSQTRFVMKAAEAKTRRSSMLGEQ